MVRKSGWGRGPWPHQAVTPLGAILGAAGCALVPEGEGLRRLSPLRVGEMREEDWSLTEEDKMRGKGHLWGLNDRRPL